MSTVNDTVKLLEDTKPTLELLTKLNGGCRCNKKECEKCQLFKVGKHIVEMHYCLLGVNVHRNNLLRNIYDNYYFKDDKGEMQKVIEFGVVLPELPNEP